MQASSHFAELCKLVIGAGLNVDFVLAPKDDRNFILKVPYKNLNKIVKTNDNNNKLKIIELI